MTTSVTVIDGRGKTHASGCPDRRRRLPRPERGDPCGRADRRRRARAWSSSASATAGAARSTATPWCWTSPLSAASCPGAARSSARPGPTRPRRGHGRRQDRARAHQGEPGKPRRRRADRDRRRGHPRRRGQAARGGRRRRRRAQDHRQRPERHRSHLRVRHRGQHRDGSHRPAAHDGREPPPGPDRGGDGPARRLDRAARGHGGRRQRDPDPGEAVRPGPGLRVGGAPVPDPVRPDRRRRRGRPAEDLG